MGKLGQVARPRSLSSEARLRETNPLTAPIQLFDLTNDLAEQNEVAARNSLMVARATDENSAVRQRILETLRTTGGSAVTFTSGMAA
jgi:hypothetical protein